MLNKKIEAEAVFEELKIKKTPLRYYLVNFFLTNPKAISQSDLILNLEKKLNKVDRVTVYRNLLFFEDKGFLHKVSENKYMLCDHFCNKHGHVIAFCQSCDNSLEIKDHHYLDKLFKIINKIDFFSSQSSFTIQGLCNKCQKY